MHDHAARQRYVSRVDRRDAGRSDHSFPLLLTIFFGPAVPPQTLATACREHRAKHAAHLAVYEAQLPDAAAHEPFPALALLSR